MKKFHKYKLLLTINWKRSLEYVKKINNKSKYAPKNHVKRYYGNKISGKNSVYGVEKRPKNIRIKINVVDNYSYWFENLNLKINWFFIN